MAEFRSFSLPPDQPRHDPAPWGCAKYHHSTPPALLLAISQATSIADQPSQRNPSTAVTRPHSPSTRQNAGKACRAPGGCGKIEGHGLKVFADAAHHGRPRGRGKRRGGLRSDVGNMMPALTPLNSNPSRTTLSLSTGRWNRLPAVVVHASRSSAMLCCMRSAVRSSQARVIMPRWTRLDPAVPIEQQDRLPVILRASVQHPSPLKAVIHM
ncbi:hypothetical protein EJ06DRAFT_70548 [Trichodelitschia bisporula]|uniref:Uncharacterized protein n=1 Tax=Trichodelitschia bisporula TaxID=703511 RepID=A0A6G1HT48_9PEZI|nr:hypothetical protein EJ06DRAFT_70548 [Trichodelitschia bisporula]